MNIYPAIDLKSGECVRLYQGNYDQVTVYEKDPVIMARSFAKQGADMVHIVDLDGAKQGSLVNLDVILKIKKETGLAIQTGGGVRSKQCISDLLSHGINRVILGSIAICEPDTVKEWIDEYGCERIVLALDVRINQNNVPMLAVHGWQTHAQKSLWQILDDYQGSTLKHVLCTDIQCDGTLQGPNVALYTECSKRCPFIEFQASGGVSSLTDLTMLAKVPVAGAIVGKALYENKFSLTNALNEARSC